MYLKVIIVSFVVLLLGALIGFLAFPLLFKELVKRSVNLKPGSETRQLWEKMPFPLTFKIYVFNVTNAQDIEMGGKPKLQEVGPFVYDEWKDKYELMDIEAENAISFNMRNTFQTRADLGLSGEELITMPHPLLQVSQKQKLFLTRSTRAETQAAVALGLDIIFKPQSAFITAKFKDLFYDGIDVNCDQKHAAAQAICQQFQAGAVPGALPVNATHYKFSLMGAASQLDMPSGNHTNAGHFKVSRSRSRQSSVGRVLAFNEAKQLHIWPELNNTSCNRLRGTDGTIFAPLMRPEQGLWSFSPQLCRSLTPKWMGRTKYNKLPAQRYELNFGSARFFQTEPDLHCYCTDYPDDCPADGTMDLVRCSGTPLMASLPHFYHADQKLLAEVEGLQPTAVKHASILIFEQFSGTVLAVHNRLQFSLKVAPVKDVPLMSQLRPLAMPLFWIEESLQLDEKITQLLHKKIFAVLNANNWFRWLSIGLGSFGCILGALFLHLTRSDAKRVGVVEAE
ncbi:sensory neuron membrane protein 1-like [Drosophila novamexicana]|uniref:sensory neuron membrane protein 1-like n=1 Tax=Drosophila novamexicana TaxID=47314 RepID=UPI0011E5C8E8|nr:sensory neuron membrane protein 1-like [Drosophila novamexicana]